MFSLVLGIGQFCFVRKDILEHMGINWAVDMAVLDGYVKILQERGHTDKQTELINRGNEGDPHEGSAG